jgi:hypothetical protein
MATPKVKFDLEAAVTGDVDVEKLDLRASAKEAASGLTTLAEQDTL